MSIFTDVKDLAGGKSQSKQWYREQLQYGLESYQGGFIVGDIIFFNYSAQTPDLKFWDTFPMVLITDVDYGKKQFSGGNMHYLRPNSRKSMANTWAAGSISYPMRCHHKYFIGRASNIRLVPAVDLRDFVPLPSEQFVRERGGVRVEIPSSFIWSRL